MFEQDVEKLLEKKEESSNKINERKEGLDLTTINSQSQTPEPKNIADNKNNQGGRVVNPQRRTLGDYAMQHGAR